MREIAPGCGKKELHPELIERANRRMPEDERLFALADLYKVFGDSTRLRILYLLFETELCVCDIAQLLGMQISAISHQLRVLKQSRLVKYRRDGKTVFYSLADDHIHSILAAGMEHVNEKATDGKGKNMKKTFNLENLDCANCAAKMEKNILKIDGVSAATVSFFAQKLILEADDARFDEIVRLAADAIHRVDADCKLLVK